ncbi:MAG: HDIG domain-containing protein [Oscillospiraceae bacterium]|nr:HDIG domain-containing protein [Oscillospiraceae bacterium]
MKKQRAVPTFFTPMGRRPNWPGLLVLFACYLLMTVGLVLAISPERYALSVNDISPKTITATKDVVDEVTTRVRREQAAEGVAASYKDDETAIERVMAELEGIFTEFESVRAYGEGLRSGHIASVSGETYTANSSFYPADVDKAREFATRMSLSDWQIETLMRQSEYNLSDLYVNTRDIVRAQMESTILEGQISIAISAIQTQLLPNVSTELGFNIAIPAVRACLEPNMVIDQEATEAARQAARDAVEPISYKSGQNIVIAGEEITAAQLAVLDSLGLLEGNRFDVKLLVGVGALGAVAMVAVLFHIEQFDRRLMRRGKNALIMATIFASTIVLSLLASQVNSYLAPVSMAALLAAALLSPSIAVILNMLSLVFVGILVNASAATFGQEMLNILVAGLLSAPVGIYLVRRRRQHRGSVLTAGLAMTLVTLLSTLSIGLLTNNEINTILRNAAWAAGGGVLAAVLCMGVQPVLEWMFALVTPYKLLELANPNQPLLRRLLVETPGTYHHAIMVANLSEAAAEAIGADPLLARVGAYYHDVGKLKRPLFFKENQVGDNPHDRTDPRVSAAIIAAHVSDGIEIAKQARLPQAIIDFVVQHHGDTVISYFYHKMRNMEGGENAIPEDFQYPGPKPQTAETAILMLADTVEAAVRAGGDQEPEAIEQRIRGLVKDKIEGGQLNESPLRFADVSRIIHAFAQVLTGIYHKRIEYPKLHGVPMLNAAPAREEASNK